MESTLSKRATLFRGSGLQALVLLTSLGLLATLALWMILSQYSEGKPGQSPIGIPQTAFEDETGVRVIRVALTAGGGMLDLRYQIVDPDKAVIVHDEENPPTIVDEVTGQAISRPWMDHSHDRELHHAVSYYELIMNVGGMIKRGSKVTIIIGDSRLEHVVVQ